MREARSGTFILPSPHLPKRRGLKKMATFIVYWDLGGGYRWRLRSGEGATVASGLRGHHDKFGCAREMGQRALEVGDALVRDATVRGFKRQPLSRWLAAQSP